MTELWTRVLQQQLSALNVADFQGTSTTSTTMGGSVSNMKSQIQTSNSRDRAGEAVGKGGGGGGAGSKGGGAASDVFHGGGGNPPRSGGSRIIIPK